MERWDSSDELRVIEAGDVTHEYVGYSEGTRTHDLHMLNLGQEICTPSKVEKGVFYKTILVPHWNQS